MPFHQVSSGGTIIDGSKFARTAMAQEFGISAIHFVPINDGEHGGVFEFGVCSSNKLNKITMQVKRGVCSSSSILTSTPPSPLRSSGARPP